MVIKRFLKDGKTDLVNFPSVKAFKKSSGGKDVNMLAYAIINAVTEVIIALIRVKKTKPSKTLPVKEETVK